MYNNDKDLIVFSKNMIVNLKLERRTTSENEKQRDGMK